MAYVRPHIRRNGQFVSGHFRRSRGGGGGGGGGDISGCLTLLVGGFVLWGVFRLLTSETFLAMLRLGAVALLVVALVAGGIVAAVAAYRTAVRSREAELERELGSLVAGCDLDAAGAERLMLLRARVQPSPEKLQAALEDCVARFEASPELRASNPAWLGFVEFALGIDRDPIGAGDDQLLVERSRAAN